MKNNCSSPYLSIIIPYRNDNYIPQGIKKLNLSLKILIDQLNSVKLDSEIILIDWNSPDPKKPLINELVARKDSKYVSLYIYEIKKSIHLKYKGYKNRNLVGATACNVGIRRSRGKFIVLKAGDTFYSEELINFLSKKKLKEDKVYRVDRIDVKIDNFLPLNFEKYFKKNIIERKSSSKNTLHSKACGDFMLMSRNLWFVIKGIPESRYVIENGSDGEALHAAIGSGAKQVYLKRLMYVYKIIHSRMHSHRYYENKSKKFDFLKIIFVGSKKNILQKFLIIMIRIILGTLNLPSTKIFNIKVRSIYRYYIVANFRKFFFGGNFIKSNNWGCADLNLKKKIVFNSNFEYLNIREPSIKK